MHNARDNAAMLFWTSIGAGIALSIWLHSIFPGLALLCTLAALDSIRSGTE